MVGDIAKRRIGASELLGIDGDKQSGSFAREGDELFVAGRSKS